MTLSITDIQHLLVTRGQSQYGGEAISQIEHALQCALLAQDAGEAPETITAALLHDLGHLLAAEFDGVNDHDQKVDDLHQFIALPFLRSLFGDAVLEPIRLHVDAKRYLCATDPSYEDTLSPASKRSLALQGGRFSAADAQAFICLPYANEAIRLRRYDDLAKVPDKRTSSLMHFIEIAMAVSRYKN